MLERALPVRTYCSHPGLGLAWLAVMISTRSPLRSSVRREPARRSPCRHAAVADVGVHRISEVDRVVAPRGSERILPLGGTRRPRSGKVHLDVLEELLRIARLVLDLEQRLRQRWVCFADRRACRRRPCTSSARRIGLARGVVHLVGADLHLDRHAVGADQVGMD